MDVKNTHSDTKTEISVFGRQALDAERRRSPSLADKVLSNCMDVSEGRIALHHRQAMSIHERKLLSLSLRAGFRKHTHPHVHRLAHAHEQSPL